MKNRKIGLLSISLSMAVCLFGGTFSNAKKVLTEEEKIMLGKDLWAMPAEVPVNGIEYTENPTYTEKTNANIFLGHMNFGTTRDYYRGDGVKVAVIDSGVNYNHEDFYNTNGDCVISDLSASILLNASQTSVVTKKVSQYGLSILDDTNGHGTNVASTIASQINGKGSLGVAPNVELVILKTNYNFAEIATALNYCINNKIDIVNMSIQSYENDVVYNGKTYKGSGASVTTYLNDYTASCYRNGIAVFAAGGNYATDEPSYPANNTNVLAVGALARDSSTNIASYSNTGSNVDVVGPGSVYVADIGGTAEYTETQGTSFACPAVVGAAALYKQLHPNASPEDIYNDLKSTCYDLGDRGVDDVFGYGRVDISAFVKPPVYVQTITPNISSIKVAPGKTVQLSCTVSPYDATNKELVYTSKNENIATVSNSGLVTGVSKGSTSISVGAADEGKAMIEIPVIVEEQTGAWTLVNDVNSLAVGDEVVFAYNSGSYTAGPISSSVMTNLGSTFSSDKSKISQLHSDTLIFTLGQTDGKWTFSNNNSLLKATAVKKLILGGSSGTGTWTISIKNNVASVTNTNTTFGTMQYNTSSPRFTTYTSGSANIQLYKFATSSSEDTPTLSKIEVSESHRSFAYGAAFVKETVTATYSDGTTEDVTNDATFSGYTANKSGQQTIKVVYEGKETTYTVTVSEPVVTNYTVTFNSNGGSGTMTSETTNGSSYVTPTCSFTKEGYTFDKWALNSTTGNKYAAETTINNISSNITLYATWTQNSSTEGQGVQMPSDYYNTITDDLTGETLLSKLRQLNLSKRTSTVGYSNMGTTPSGSYRYTDYDPTTVKYDGNGQPYGTAILSFYSGKSCTSWNREHVWPNSRGGGSGGAAGDPHPDADIFMPRPTINEENSDRGNSKYVEGIVSTTAGWDPVAAFEKTLGVYPGIRGECARIIFYCMTVNSNLVLDDTATGGTIGVTMGKLSDLLRWNLENPVNDREIRRQSGGQYLQNNRNAFVDDPGYACRIWGNYNESTRQICSQTPVEDKNLVELEATGSPTKTTYSADESFDPTGLTIIAKYDDGNTEDVTSKVQWSQLVSGESEVTGTYTYKTTSKSVIISGLTITASKVSYFDVIKSGALQKGYSSVGTYSSSSGYGSLYGTNYLTSGYLDLEGGSKIKVTCDIGTYGGYKTDGSQNLTIGLYDADGKLISSTATFGPSKTNTKQGNDIVTCTLTLNSGKQSGFIRIVPNSSSTSGSFARLYNLNLEYTPYQEVCPQVKTITLSTNSLSFNLYNDKNPKTITATVEADEGADTTVIWLSSDEDVATVENGVVTPHNEGNVIITAKSKSNPEIKDTCTVSVTDSSPKPVTGITLNETSLQLVIGSKFTLVCTFAPTNATNKNVTWSSSDENVATVSDGVVTSKAVGSATITVTTEDGGFTATCTITVSATPEITYKLEADNEVPYMSGTNHSASVGVKLYEYTNGVKGNSVKTGTTNVDTSVLGEQDISIVYNSVTYYGKAKVTNYGADVGESSQAEPTIQNKSASFTIESNTTSSWKMPAGWSATANGTTGYESGRGIQLQKSASITFSLPTYQNITSISIDVARSSNGKGTFSILVGSNTEKTISSFETTSKTETVTFSTPKSGSIKIQGSASASSLYIKKIVVNYQEITEGQTITHNATPVQQAEAWADYFVRLTGGGAYEGPCKLDPNDRQSALENVWEELSKEYGYMKNESKTAFCSSEASFEIQEAMKHYRYIISKYDLTDFINPPAVNSSNRLISVSNSSSFVVGIIALVGLTAIGSYFIYKKRREE